MTLIKDGVDLGESESNQNWRISKENRPLSSGKAPVNAIPSHRPSPHGTGILSVGLSQAVNLSIPHPDNGSSPVGFADPDVRKRWLPYAVLEYEKFQVSTEFAYWARKGTVIWDSQTPIKFDVSASSELIVYLFARSSDASKKHQVVALGSIRLNPFPEPRTPVSQWLDIQDGMGKVRLEVSYTEREILPLQSWKMWEIFKNTNTGDFVYVEKQDTNQSYRSYAMKTIPTAEIGPELDLVHSLYSRVEHPFIAPLKFAVKSPDGISLLSELASGGHLFSHLQRERRLDVDIARFYAAELVCTLEYLHDKGIILASLKPENILLDAFGHISLCSPGIFGLETKDQDCIMGGGLEYPAPEIILGHQPSRKVDWWSLGIILYEIVIGWPPFYHEDSDKRRRKIVDEPLPQLPDKLLPSARDFLVRVLYKDPEKRLGTNGSSEVKAHAFFNGVDWNELLERKYTSHFKLINTTTIFRVEPDKPYPPAVRRQSKGIIYEKMDIIGSTYWRPIDRIRDENEDKLEQDSSKFEDDGWELVWDQTTREFHFNNHFTNEKRPASLKAPQQVVEIQKPLVSLPVAENNSTAQQSLGPISHSLPSQPQKEDALAAALKAGYGSNAVSQVLEYKINLNTSIIYYDGMRDGDSELFFSNAIPITPLEWAVEHDNINLVNLFLDKGADANFTAYETEGPALIKAVRRRNRKLVEILARRTNRVSMTRALCLAVDQQDITIVNALLVNGACCNFEERDRPPPPDPRWNECTLGMAPPLQAEHFIPPIVRAARLGNVGLVRLLLEKSADPNTSYHVYRHEEYKYSIQITPINFFCGWVVQIAMEFGHLEIVQLLLDAGANIDLAQPVWPVRDHTCPLVPRSEYLRVTAGLEAAAAARNSKEVAI
ncbi:hypothetical protein V491_01860 [Pseudogymnoascus sp. VKM F-3775]|nr:hypothetical protein V491_01860 [Pseudogymnoascus sp. VKM F-3775]